MELYELLNYFILIYFIALFIFLGFSSHKDSAASIDPHTSTEVAIKNDVTVNDVSCCSNDQTSDYENESCNTAGLSNEAASDHEPTLSSPLLVDKVPSKSSIVSLEMTKIFVFALGNLRALDGRVHSGHDDRNMMLSVHVPSASMRDGTE